MQKLMLQLVKALFQDIRDTQPGEKANLQDVKRRIQMIQEAGVL